MAAQLPTFYLLNGAVGWRMRDENGQAVGQVNEIRLAGDPNGPLVLNSPDGSLGGLVLPRGVAFDRHGILYLLGRQTPWIKRFDPDAGSFVTLDGIGGDGSEARTFHAPGNIGIA